jgi:predicted nucleic acid-binding protein
MNASRAFFDTNVLLYMYSDSDLRKYERARSLYQEYASSGRGLLSTQVVQEFFAAGLKKLALPRHHIQQITTTFLDAPLVIVGPSQIRAAIETADHYQISFWDALILAAAESGGADILFTEDLNHGQRYGRVLAQNPFLPI